MPWLTLMPTDHGVEVDEEDTEDHMEAVMAHPEDTVEDHMEADMAHPEVYLAQQDMVHEDMDMAQVDMDMAHLVEDMVMEEVGVDEG